MVTVGARPGRQQSVLIPENEESQVLLAGRQNMPISDRTKQLFDQMRKLAAELAALGHQRDETQIDAMLGYPVRGDFLKLLRDWERKLQQIVRVESDLKDALTDDGILPKRKKKKPTSRRNRK
jgi:hypothetical protein